MSKRNSGILINKITILSIICIPFFSCNESPVIDFHSYEELSQYTFLSDGWFPEILGEDAFNIKETYDVNTKHVFGKFEFSNRIKCDSIIRTYTRLGSDSLKAMIENVNIPLYPEWFISKHDLNKGNYIFVKQMDFYLILEKKANKIYYIR